tara:strand:- start:101 stop:301 length:201 start_codon:yes stop_codon:yes gene_type:complete
MFNNYRFMMKGAKFFEQNPIVQTRFEENEDWLEDLEEELDKLVEKQRLIRQKLAEIEALLVKKSPF